MVHDLPIGDRHHQRRRQGQDPFGGVLHKELDVIRIDVLEELPVDLDLNAFGQLHLQLQKDYPFEDRVEDNIYLSWHENHTGIAANRCFGTAMAFDVPEGCTESGRRGSAWSERAGPADLRSIRSGS